MEKEDTKVEVPEDSTAVKLVHQKHTLKHALPPLSHSPVYIPTSMSAPTVMFYKYLNTSAVYSPRSISSLPNTKDDVASSTDNATTSTDDTTDVTFSAATSVKYLKLNSQEPLGPGGMSIPSIQTSAPLDGTTVSISPGRRTHPLLTSFFCSSISHQQRPAEQLPHVQWCSRRS